MTGGATALDHAAWRGRSLGNRVATPEAAFVAMEAEKPGRERALTVNIDTQ